MKSILSLPVSSVLKRHGELTEKLSRWMIFLATIA
ncbi:hypothetical protein OROMI_020111 [Orobanche minor]